MWKQQLKAIDTKEKTKCKATNKQNAAEKTLIKNWKIQIKQPQRKTA